MSATRSGAAASSARWSRCRPRPPAGPPKSPAAARAGRWRAPPRPRCSTRWSRTPCGRCRPGRSCWRPGRRRRSARTSTSRSSKVLYSVPWRLIGKTVDVRHHRARWSSSSSAASWSRPTRARSAGKQTDFTDYPPEKIALPHADPGSGAAGRPPGSARPARRSSASCWTSTPSTGSAPPRASSGSPTSTIPAGSRRPAPRRSRSATRPTAPSRASWPPGPNGTSCPAAAGDGGAAAFLRGPASFAQRHPPAQHASPATPSPRQTTEEATS